VHEDALNEIARCGLTQPVQAVVDSGRFAQQDQNGQTVLHKIVMQGNVDQFDILRGALTRERPDQWDALRTKRDARQSTATIIAETIVDWYDKGDTDEIREYLFSDEYWSKWWDELLHDSDIEEAWITGVRDILGKLIIVET